MAARNASLFGVADFYSRNFIALGHQAQEIHVNNTLMQSAWASEHGFDSQGEQTTPANNRIEPPGWLLRYAAPFKPLLRPLARKIGLSPSLEPWLQRLLLNQVEAFRPDLILNQDIFNIDTNLVRKIKTIGNPFIIGQVALSRRSTKTGRSTTS